MARHAAAYAPPAADSENGHLLFLRAGTLMAQPLDARRFEFVGEPFPVAEQVGSMLQYGFFGVSANGVLAYRSSASQGLMELVRFDRAGKSIGTLGPRGTYTGGLALALDGKRVAVDEMDQAGKRDIRLLDVARGVPTRFTFEGQVAGPAWSPDGKRLLFAFTRGSASEIHQKNSSGSGNEELFLKPGRPEDWSPDGRYLLYSDYNAKTKMDLWVLPAEGKPIPYLQTPSSDGQGRFSPDGHWVAYISDEAGPGQYQIYVQSFPIGVGKFQVSTGAGGTQPRWRLDGKELFYLSADGKLTAVEVKTAPTFEAGTPHALFDPQTLGGRNFSFSRSDYDVAADGKRFLVISVPNTPESPASAPITVVVNWLAALKH